MAGINAITTKMLENKKFAEFAAGAADAVYVTTGIKATARPTIIYADKHSDKKMKKYTASKEFIYQAVCLLVAVSIVPVFRKAGFLSATRILKKINAEDVEKLRQTYLDGVKAKFQNKYKNKVVPEKAKQKFEKKITDINKIDFAKIKNDTKFDKFYKAMENTVVLDRTTAMMQRIHGGELLGEFVGSLFGLTILSPILSMKVLHPILKACGVENAKPDKSAKT